MVIVAVVGGTGSVGKTIVDAFKADGAHEVLVLCRKVRPQTSNQSESLSSDADSAKVPEGEQPVPTYAVDYNNIEQIAKTLEQNKVHTIVSTIVMYDPVAAQSERNLIEAAAKAATVKRFVQSNWGDETPDEK